MSEDLLFPMVTLRYVKTNSSEKLIMGNERQESSYKTSPFEKD
jgi:hypothetical protein